MSNNAPRESQELDDMLAAYVDAVLDRVDPALSDEYVDNSMAELQRMAQRLDAAFDDQPPESMVARIEENLLNAWADSGLAAKKQKPIFTRITEGVFSKQTYRSARRRRQTYALVLAGASLLALAIILPVAGGMDTGDLPGGAGAFLDNPAMLFAVLGGAIVFAAVIWWFNREKS